MKGFMQCIGKDKISGVIYFFSLMFFTSLGAASFTVSSNTDSGVGSLRQAILNLNASSDLSNTITINPGLSPIVLSSDLPIIQKPVNISTTGAVPQVINGNSQFRLIASSSPLSIANCTLQNGAAIGGNGATGMNISGGGGGGMGAGGGIYLDQNQSLVLSSNVTLSNNIAKGGSGGNVNNSGTPTSGGGEELVFLLGLKMQVELTQEGIKRQ